MKKNILLILILMVSAKLYAQEYLYSLNRDMNIRIESFFNRDTSGFHSSMKPVTIAELKRIMPLDSIWQPIVGTSKFYQTWTGRKLRKEHLVFVDEDDIVLSVDPVFNFQIGRDLKTDRNVYINTKGLSVNGNVKDKFFFYTQFHENQARYTN